MLYRLSQCFKVMVIQSRRNTKSGDAKNDARVCTFLHNERHVLVTMAGRNAQVKSERMER